MIEVGQRLKVDIARTMNDGKATAFTEDDTLVIIEGVSEDDETVEAEVVRVYEETVYAKKIAGARSESKKFTRNDLTNSPYDVDDEDDEDDEDDDEEY